MRYLPIGCDQIKSLTFWTNGGGGRRSREVPERAEGGTSLLFLQWQVRNKVSPALLLSSLSFMCGQDFSCKDDKKIQKKKRKPTLSLLSLQRFKTFFIMVCCKNRAFLKKRANTSSKRLLRNYFEYI